MFAATASLHQLRRICANSTKPGLVIAALDRSSAPELLEAALANPSSEVRRLVLRRPEVHEVHLLEALDDVFVSVRRVAVEHPNATDAVHRKALDGPEAEIAGRAAECCSTKMIDLVLDDARVHVRLMGILNPNLTSEQIARCLADPEPEHRIEALHRCDTTIDQAENALRDPDPDVRGYAACHFTDEYLLQQYVFAGWMPSAAEWLIERRPDQDIVPAGTLEALLLLAEMDRTPDEAFWDTVGVEFDIEP